MKSHVAFKKRFPLAISFLFMILFLSGIACQADLINFQKLQTSDYSLFVPRFWQVKGLYHSSQNRSPLNFSMDDRQIGGIQILRYDSREPLQSQSSIFGNHVSRILQIENVRGTKVPVQQALFERNWIENRQAFVSYELHAYYMPGGQMRGSEVTYDFYLQTEKISTEKNPDFINLNKKQAKKEIWKNANINQGTFPKIIKSLTFTALYSN